MLKNKKAAVPMGVIVAVIILFIVGIIFHVLYNLILLFGIATMLFISWLLLLWAKKGWIGPTTVASLSTIFIILFYKTPILDLKLYQIIIEFIEQDPNVWDITIHAFLAVISSFICLLVFYLPLRIINSIR